MRIEIDIKNDGSGYVVTTTPLMPEEGSFRGQKKQAGGVPYLFRDGDKRQLAYGIWSAASQLGCTRELLDILTL